MLRKIKRNTPIAQLIKDFSNKKSGKVSESRIEIKRRFEFLDWKGRILSLSTIGTNHLSI